MHSWKKLGLIFKPDSTLWWQHTHAAVPTRLLLGGSNYRIFFCSRDERNRTHIGYFDFDAGDPLVILNRSETPVLSPGPLGYFDDHGVQACSIVRRDNVLYMYYLGWNPGLTTPLFYTSIGLAISEDNGNTWRKYSPAPVMERSKFDPWMVSGPTVLYEQGVWRMWYISGFKFEIESGTATSFYDIKYAESTDGINWKREGVVSLPLHKDETNISRISILKENGKYHCWYPYKKINQSYRLGYAVSDDGIKWMRLDSLAGIDVSSSGWDSEAIDKVEVIRINDKNKVMLYNGNRFGMDGIGAAIVLL